MHIDFDILFAWYLIGSVTLTLIIAMCMSGLPLDVQNPAMHRVIQGIGVFGGAVTVVLIWFLDEKNRATAGVSGNALFWLAVTTAWTALLICHPKRWHLKASR